MNVVRLARYARLCSLLFAVSGLAAAGAWGYANREAIAAKSSELYKKNGLRPERWYFSAMGVDLNMNALTDQLKRAETPLIGSSPIDISSFTHPAHTSFGGLNFSSPPLRGGSLITGPSTRGSSGLVGSGNSHRPSTASAGSASSARTVSNHRASSVPRTVSSSSPQSVSMSSGMASSAATKKSSNGNSSNSKHRGK